MTTTGRVLLFAYVVLQSAIVIRRYIEDRRDAREFDARLAIMRGRIGGEPSPPTRWWVPSSDAVATLAILIVLGVLGVTALR